MAARAKKYLETLVILLSFILPVFALVPWAELAQISDFMEYYAISQLMQMNSYGQIYNLEIVEHLQRILVPNSLHSYLPFFISPILAWMVYPLAFLPFQISLYTWTIALALLLLVLYVVLCKSCNLQGIQKCWVVAILAASGPCIESIRLGQLSPVLLLGVVGLLLGLKQKRFFLAAASQSLLWLKPHLILPLLLFESGAGLGNVSIISVLAAILGLIVSATFGGVAVISHYWQTIVLNQTHESILALTYGPILRGQLLKFSCGLDLANSLSALAYGLLLILSYFFGLYAKKRKMSVSSIFTVVVPASLCFAPHLFNYDLLLLVPGCILLLAYPLTGRLTWIRMFILTLLTVLFVLPCYIYLHYFYVCSGSVINPFFWGILIFIIGAIYIEWALNESGDANARLG